MAVPFIKEPIKSRVYSLILDMDETLIHFKFMKSEGQILLRPYVNIFLEKMSKFYELIVFTAGEKEYADWILDRLDPKNRLISHRLYRRHTDIFDNKSIKDLSKVGRDLSKTILLDNSPHNFSLQPQNGLFIKSWYGDQNDQELKNLIPFLISLEARNPYDLRKQLQNSERY